MASLWGSSYGILDSGTTVTPVAPWILTQLNPPAGPTAQTQTAAGRVGVQFYQLSFTISNIQEHWKTHFGLHETSADRLASSCLVCAYPRKRFNTFRVIRDTASSTSTAAG
jgi:hypothetical protein